MRDAIAAGGGWRQPHAGRAAVDRYLRCPQRFFKPGGPPGSGPNPVVRLPATVCAFSGLPST
jgi:hypothetical protein